MSIIFLFKEYSLREIGYCDVEIKSGGIGSILQLFSQCCQNIYLRENVDCFPYQGVLPEGDQCLNSSTRAEGREKAAMLFPISRLGGCSSVQTSICVGDTNDFSLFPPPFLSTTCQLDIAMCPRHRF